MVNWISLVVLFTLAVSTLSLPVPDWTYKIPHVGTGRRAQYSILHRDGTYKYGHDTGEGAFESAKSTRVGEIKGRFGYVDPDGNPIRIQYEAGEEGFVPTGSHIPQPHPDFHAAHAEVRTRLPFVDPLANPFADASYGFQFDEEGQRRSEQSDSKGNVRGSYSYVDEEGVIRTYTYKAGRNIGFVVTGNDLPVSPDPLGSSGSTPADTSYSSAGRQIFSTISSSGTSALTSSAQGSSPTSSSVATVRSSAGSHSATQSANKNDGSYSFSFNSGDQSRSESADANLNVAGRYSFVADDGVRRHVNYEAGANRGFTASGDHFPVAPSANGVTSASSAHGSTSVSSALQSVYASSSLSGSPSEEANTSGNLRPDGTYSLEYETSSHSRQEAGDSSNNVDGDFAFVADDGQRRQIKFQAGAETGFIAEGDHIPVGPAVPGAPSGQPTGKIVPAHQVPFFDPLADSNADASYNFAFDSEQYSRSETADSDGNVQGTYTVVDDDGTHRIYRFRAGEGIGFETKQVSSYKGPIPSKILSTSQYSASQNGAASSSASASTGTSSPSSATGHVAASSTSSLGVDTSDFQLRQYEASKNPHKFGYVLTFNN